MKKFLILFLILSTPCLADVQTDKYLISKPDGSVDVLYYIPSSNDSLSKVLSDLGYSGYQITQINDSDLKKVSRADRKYWKRGVVNKIEIDTVKKQADLEAKNQKDTEKQAVLTKLKITDQELKSVLGK